jgi:hypothetical protein
MNQSKLSLEDHVSLRAWKMWSSRILRVLIELDC